MSKVLYKSFSDHEFNVLISLISSVRDLILSMISNYVLISPEKNSISKILNENHSHSDIKFQKFIGIKDLLMNCIPLDYRKDLFDRAIIDIQMNEFHKIIFKLSKKFCILNIKNPRDFIEDILKIQDILNDSNKKFLTNLNQALNSGKMKQNQLVISAENITKGKLKYKQNNKNKDLEL